MSGLGRNGIFSAAIWDRSIILFWDRDREIEEENYRKKEKGYMYTYIERETTSISSEARRNQTSILIRGRENRVSP